MLGESEQVVDADSRVLEEDAEHHRRDRQDDERENRQQAVADLVTFIVSSRATWLHGATIDLDGGEIPVL